MKSVKDQLEKHEQSMRENAYAIFYTYEKMNELNRINSRNAMLGIIEYLQGKIGEDNQAMVNNTNLIVARLEDNQDNYDKGLLTTIEYEDNKKAILANKLLKVKG